MELSGTEGQAYSFKVRFIPAAGASLKVTWSSAQISGQALPTTALSPSVMGAQAVAAPTAAQPPLAILNATFDQVSGRSFGSSWATGLSAFEEGVKAASATGADPYWQAADYSAALSADAHAGTALKLTPGQEYNLFTSEVDVQRAPAYFHTGATYELSAFVKSASGANCSVQLLEPALNLGAPSANDQFVKLTSTFTYSGAPTNLNILLKNSGTANCLFDDVKLTWLSNGQPLEQASNNLLQNADFETNPAVLTGWNLAGSTYQQGSFTVTPGADGSATALGFKTAARTIVAGQRIYASSLLPNTKYLLKGKCI